MVGRDQDSPFVPSGFHGLPQGADDVAVDPFQGLDLGVGPAFVAGLVGGLDVDADDVVVLEGRDPVSPLGGVVGIEISGRPGDVDPVPTRQDPTPRTRSTAERIAPFLPWIDLKLRQARGLALAPEPDRVGGRLAPADPGQVDRVVADDGSMPSCIRSSRSSVRARPSRQVVDGRLGRGVVRAA